MVWIYLDDERGLPLEGDILVSDFRSVINLITIFSDSGIDFAIDFDYDLGEDDYFSGYTVAQYIVDHKIPMKEFHIHSANLRGSIRIRDILTLNGYKEV